jgi:hypothetical protein
MDIGESPKGKYVSIAKIKLTLELKPKDQKVC